MTLLHDCPWWLSNKSVPFISKHMRTFSSGNQCFKLQHASSWTQNVQLKGLLITKFRCLPKNNMHKITTGHFRLTVLLAREFWWLNSIAIYTFLYLTARHGEQSSSISCISSVHYMANLSFTTHFRVVLTVSSNYSNR